MTEDAMPTTPETAQARLTELAGNADWSSRVLAQDPIAFGDFRKLTTVMAKNPTTETLAGALTSQTAGRCTDRQLDTLGGFQRGEHGIAVDGGCRYRLESVRVSHCGRDWRQRCRCGWKCGR